jgi:2-methylcitrate dehydratase PrpD
MVATPARAAGLGPYCVTFLDWLACASAGAREPAARAVESTGNDLVARVAFAGTAGHVLDYDDTFSDGVAHVSAACAPAALVVASELGLSLGEALAAYAEGYEVMAELAAANHPALYDGGWHPTAVCGPVGATVAAALLFDLSDREAEHAVALSLLRAGGTRGAFGSDGKAIQVGLGAAAGVQAVLLARGGATASERVIRSTAGFEGVFGARWPQAAGGGSPASGRGEGSRPRAIERTWIKRYPSCLGTHSPIEAAARARSAIGGLDHEPVEVRVHPTARRAAHLDGVENGLEAKFSIPYCVAHTISNGPPGLRDFGALDLATRERSRLVTVELDSSLPEFAAVLVASGEPVARLEAPMGSPERPIPPSELAEKVSELTGDNLTGVLDDLAIPASNVLGRAFQVPLVGQVQGGPWKPEGGKPT